MKRVALLGMPNTGKSTLFNRLSGASARVGNWPGVTVDLMTAKIMVGGDMAEIIDLPGIYDLHGYADDEKVVRHFLEQQKVDLLVVLVNAVQLERQLVLPLQLKELGFPLVVLINMSDEAKKLGIGIDTASLARGLGTPVVAISAKYGDGQRDMMSAMTRALGEISTHGTLPAPGKRRLEEDDAFEVRAAALIASSVDMPTVLPERFSDKLDDVLMHKLWGLPLFFLAMFGVFAGVFWLGAPIQSGVQDALGAFGTHVLTPVVSALPELARGLVVDGIFNGVSTVASFVPMIVLFFFFMAVIEDSGYLSRAAYLMDALMAKMGLDGRSFVMLLMGFGCNVPALMGTRVMRSRALRLLSMLVIPFSLCSARLQVFLFIIAALFSPRQAPFVLLSLYLASFVIAFLTALIFKRSKQFSSDEPFVIELPPYRLPTLHQVWTRGWLEARHFLLRASKIIIAGVVLVWLLTHLPAGVTPAGVDSYSGIIGRFMQPVLGPLGIDEKLTIALIFGFVAKEVVIGALAVIYGMEGAALTSHISHSFNWVQAYSFMLFTLIYTPCLSTIATLRAESRSLRFTLLAVAWPLLLAWTVSFVFYQTFKHLV
ncbi:Fe(2+) transporter FeoB [Georgfuchsia toluolica]|uniref:Ferrous iron transport protein B n=1 Tax=Georgfuchsia toluolica TaxID=424218 RepID=A0A916NA50_9PROT|nr:ferrous iron transport protein B [Georgfuchsia toluolica]CAG4884907.1 Fe(2+) transporter FeoB [Georgfuchsia toluolica]